MIRDINIVRWKGANYQSPVRRMICMLAHRSILLIIVRIYVSNIIIYAYNNVYWCVFYIYKHRTIGRTGNNLLKQLAKKFCYTHKILCITRALSEFILHLKRPQLLAKFHIIKLNLASNKTATSGHISQELSPSVCYYSRRNGTARKRSSTSARYTKPRNSNA